MPKDRLKETFEYLEPIVRSGAMAPLYAADLQIFKDLVENDDRTNSGEDLSLDWNVFTRPNHETRHALRAWDIESGAPLDFLTACVLVVFGLNLPLALAAACLSIIHLVVLATGVLRLARLRGLSADLALLAALVPLSQLQRIEPAGILKGE